MLIDSGGRLWLGLCEEACDGVLEFWSTKPEESERVPYKAIIDDLRGRLARVERGEENTCDDRLCSNRFAIPRQVFESGTNLPRVCGIHRTYDAAEATP